MIVRCRSVKYVLFLVCFSQVHCEHVREVAHIIRAALENAVSLSVQLPVKMKVGETWGSLQEIML
jgi:DNA polymerase I-like protein with 3'-5' exonuclease and polymerase domains